MGTRIKDENIISDALASLGAGIAMMSIDTLPVPNFDLSSETQDEFDEDMASDIAENLSKFIRAKSRSLRILTDTQLNQKVADVMKKNEHKDA